MKNKKLVEKQRRRLAEQQRLAQGRRQARRQNLVTGGIALAVLLVVGALVLNERGADSDESTAPEGVRSFSEVTAQHVETEVDYPQTPPAGGNHNPVWQNCGIYDSPIRDENAVHSLEHGAVWITYRPDLSQSDRDQLRSTVDGDTYALLSPYEDLPSPVVASAWGKQLRLESADDERLEQFIRAYRLGPEAPEPGAACTGGTGEAA